jgi:hypothetical protein
VRLGDIVQELVDRGFMQWCGSWGCISTLAAAAHTVTDSTWMSLLYRTVATLALDRNSVSQTYCAVVATDRVATAGVVTYRVIVVATCRVAVVPICRVTMAVVAICTWTTVGIDPILTALRAGLPWCVHTDSCPSSLGC